MTVDYDDRYSIGYEDCKRDMNRRTIVNRQLRKANTREKLYFVKQKIIGVIVLALTMVGVKLMDGDATFAIVTVPIGLAMIFSRSKLWTDKYYFETEGKHYDEK